MLTLAALRPRNAPIRPRSLITEPSPNPTSTSRPVPLASISLTEMFPPTLAAPSATKSPNGPSLASKLTCSALADAWASTVVPFGPVLIKNDRSPPTRLDVSATFSSGTFFAP